MERAFSFKLLVPPRTCTGQISAVKPQESGLFEDNDSLTSTVQGFSKSFDKESSMAFSNTNMVLPTKSTRAEVTKKIAVMPMEKEETPLQSSQLYSKLFEEAEKIKAWKLKMDSDISQKDRKLRENRRTIETQRKAIQELQFENETLSMKLEEQLNENEDLRNKNNATRNLCNILKDTFERSSEKMSLFEAERDETHSLFIQSHENIQTLASAFERLRTEAEADHQELLKGREDLKQLEDFKLRVENEYHMKEEEVSVLEGKLREKESHIKEMLLNLEEMHKRFTELQDSSKQQQEVLEACKEEQKELQEKLNNAEQLKLETEEKQESLANTFEEAKKEYVKNLQEKDIKLEELNRIKDQFAHQLDEMQITIESLQSSLTCEKNRVQELESEHSSIHEELLKKNTELGKTKQMQDECENQIQTLRYEMQTQLNALNSSEAQAKADAEKIIQFTADLEVKQTEINKLKEKLQLTTAENENVVIKLRDAINEQNLLKEQALLKEVKLQELERQLTDARKNETESSTCIKILEKDISHYKERYDDLLDRCDEFNLRKNTVQKEGITSETKEGLGNEENMKMELVKLDLEKQQLQKQLEVLSAEFEGKLQENKNIQGELKESNKSLQSRLMRKERQFKALEQKLTNLNMKLETKTKAYKEILKEIFDNKALKVQMTLNNEKCFHHETEITKLKEECQNMKRHYEEEYMKIRSDLENKTASETQLKLEVVQLKQSAMETTKSKEDTEIKCQQKISDMVALMERHKHEYDRMVEEKDAELSEKRMREAEVNANKTSLELELSHLQVENEQLKQKFEETKIRKENLEQEVRDLTKMKLSQKDTYTKKEGCLEQEILALKKQIKYLEKDKTQKLSEINSKNERNSEIYDIASPKMSTQDFSKKAETATPPRKGSATPCQQRVDGSLLKMTSWTLETKTGTTPRIRSFRIRTPPSAEKSVLWKKNALELDPKSDSSDQNDILSFSSVSVKSKNKKANDSGGECLGLFKKVQSSAGYKSPGAALKLAAMKRMRDAGWTTITSLEKKKKKITEKIFA